MCFIDNAREVQGAVVLIALQRYDILKARWRALADIVGFRQFFLDLPTFLARKASNHS